MQWGFDSSLRDIESVACDPVNNVIYIAQEEAKVVTAFRFPLQEGDWDVDDFGNRALILLYQFPIIYDAGDSKSGIEGMTVDTKENLLCLVNEKHPKVFYKYQSNGVLRNETYPNYSGDLSGVCYDEVLNLFWFVSDQSERVYVTDKSGTIVFDYWDLSFENGEGIAIDNNHKPPLLYIATDPSGGSGGPDYVPALFKFEKPEIGTGLVYYDPENPPEYEIIPCDGCDEVWAEVDARADAYAAKKRHDRIMIAVAVILPSVGGIVLAILVLGLIASIYRHRSLMKEYYSGLGENNDEGDEFDGDEDYLLSESE